MLTSDVRRIVKSVIERETAEAKAVSTYLKQSGLPILPEFYFKSAKRHLVSQNIGTETDIPITQQLLFDGAVKLSINPWPRMRWERFFGIAAEMAVPLSQAGLILPVLRHRRVEDWNDEHEYLAPILRNCVCPGIRFQRYLLDSLPASLDYDELMREYEGLLRLALTSEVISHIAFFELVDSIDSLVSALTNRFVWLHCRDGVLGETIRDFLDVNPVEAIKASRILYEAEIMPIHTAMCGTVSVSRQTRALYGVPSIAHGDLGIDINDQRSMALVGAKVRNAVTALIANENHWPIAFEYFPESRGEQTSLVDRLIRLNSGGHTSLKDDFKLSFERVVSRISQGEVKEMDVVTLMNQHEEVRSEIERQNESLSNLVKGLSWGAIALVSKAAASNPSPLLIGCGVVGGLTAKIYESPALKWIQSLNRKCLTPEQRLIYAVSDVKRL